MTKKRNDAHSTEFGLWLREQPEIDSRIGFVATNLDYIWHNYKTGDWMLIEEKRGYNKFIPKVKRWQRGIFNLLHKAALNDNSYRGFYFIAFANTSPDDGDIYINNQKASTQDLINLLKFDSEYIYISKD